MTDFLISTKLLTAHFHRSARCPAAIGPMARYGCQGDALITQFSRISTSLAIVASRSTQLAPTRTLSPGTTWPSRARCNRSRHRGRVYAAADIDACRGHGCHAASIKASAMRLLMRAFKARELLAVFYPRPPVPRQVAYLDIIQTFAATAIAIRPEVVFALCIGCSTVRPASAR